MADWRKQLIKQAEACCNISWGLSKMVKEPEQLFVWLDAFEQGDMFQAAEPSVDEVEEALNRRYGRHVGLNADWSVKAWLVEGKTKGGHEGLFLIDNEDDTWSLVKRTDMRGEDNDIIEDVQWFDTGVKLFKWMGEPPSRALLPPRQRPVKLPRGVKIEPGFLPDHWLLVDDILIEGILLDLQERQSRVKPESAFNFLRPEDMVEAQLAFVTVQNLVSKLRKGLFLTERPYYGMYVTAGGEPGTQRTVAARYVQSYQDMDEDFDHVRWKFTRPASSFKDTVQGWLQVHVHLDNDPGEKARKLLKKHGGRLPAPELRPERGMLGILYLWSLRYPRFNSWTRRERD